MANDYFEQQFTGQSHGQANVDSVIASLERVEGGFDKIPTLEQLWTDSVTSAIATGCRPTNYRVTLPYSDRLTAYVDQMRIGVRMPTGERRSRPTSMSSVRAESGSASSPCACLTARRWSRRIGRRR